jgi:pilus assembly protein Flp/PilA
MRRLPGAMIRFAKDEDGAALVEYALLVALLALVVIVAMTTLGTKVSEKLSELASKL